MTDAPGEDADRPLDIPRAGWKAILLRVWTDIGRDHVSLIAAGVAFYGLLALFPAITALVAIGGLMFEPSDIANRLEGLASLLPEGAAEIITTQAMEVAGSRGGGLGLTALLGIGLALYSASKGIASLIEGINVAYDEEETRGFFHRTALTLGLTEVRQRVHHPLEGRDGVGRRLAGLRKLGHQVAQHALQGSRAGAPGRWPLEAVTAGALAAERLELDQGAHVDLDLGQRQLFADVLERRARVRDALQVEAEAMSAILQRRDHGARAAVERGRRVEDPVDLVEVEPRLGGVELLEQLCVGARRAAQILQRELQIAQRLALHRPGNQGLGGLAGRGGPSWQNADGSRGVQRRFQQALGSVELRRALGGRRRVWGRAQELIEPPADLPAELERHRRRGKPAQPSGQARRRRHQPVRELVWVLGSAWRGKRAGALEHAAAAPEQAGELDALRIVAVGG